MDRLALLTALGLLGCLPLGCTPGGVDQDSGSSGGSSGGSNGGSSAGSTDTLTQVDLLAGDPDADLYSFARCAAVGLQYTADLGYPNASVVLLGNSYHDGDPVNQPRSCDVMLADPDRRDLIFGAGIEQGKVVQDYSEDEDYFCTSWGVDYTLATRPRGLYVDLDQAVKLLQAGPWQGVAFEATTISIRSVRMLADGCDAGGRITALLPKGLNDNLPIIISQVTVDGGYLFAAMDGRTSEIYGYSED